MQGDTPIATPIKILDRQFFASGTMVIRQGTDGARAYFVESGAAEVFFKNPDGSETIIAELGPGDLFGEMAIISGEKRTASVRTVKNSVLIVLHAHALHTAVDHSDALYKKMVYIMVERLKKTHDHLSKDKEPLDKGITKEVAAALLEKLEATIERLK